MYHHPQGDTNTKRYKNNTEITYTMLKMITNNVGNEYYYIFKKISVLFMPTSNL